MNLAEEYDNRARVPNHPQIISGWNRDAAAYRAMGRCDLDIAYGAKPRMRLDVFHPVKDAGGPLVLFIHGGYWRAFDKSDFSHMAAGANAHGVTVAVPGYSLCPQVSVSDIIDELRQCCLFLHKRFGQKIVVAGHSAGGHLAACMAATGWEHFGADPEMIHAGMSISGIFDLRPLIVTPQNDDLRLNGTDAMIASPILWPVPRKLPFDSWVGGDESFEFQRQAWSLAAAWTGLGFAAPYTVAAGENHFSVINALADPETPMTKRLVELASA